MEVQKHPHHVTHAKKWFEYLLEFLMLFLAVFLGFIAENMRENIADRRKEKEYISSLIRDIQTDTAKISSVIKGYNLGIRNADTLMKNFDSLDLGYSVRLWRCITFLQGYPDFIYTDGTIQQLKNAGGFRLIGNKKAIDSILAYDASVKRALLNESGVSVALENMHQKRLDFIHYKALDKAFNSGKTLLQLQNEKFDFILT